MSIDSVISIGLLFRIFAAFKMPHQGFSVFERNYERKKYIFYKIDIIQNDVLDRHAIERLKSAYLGRP